MRSSKWTWWTMVALPFAVYLALMPAQTGLAQADSWTEPIIISSSFAGSWFPDVAVDAAGNVHVVWCESTPMGHGRVKEQVYYSGWDGQEWSAPNDIVPPSWDIIRNAIAADGTGRLHLLFGGSVINPLTTYYTGAPLGSAGSAASWTPPHILTESGSYMSDIAVDSQGTIHAIYDQKILLLGCNPRTEICTAFADVFYRRSTDGGRGWSYPKNLSRSPTGSSRAQMEIDSQDNVYVVWDEGWDRLSGEGEPVSGAYTFSRDGGQTWSEPIVFSYPDNTNAQTAVGVDGQGGVLAVWMATSRDEMYYAWSPDYGVSWSDAETIPGLFARPWQVPFDMYDMATDSMGHIHLVAVGRRSRDSEAPLGVYHLEWGGSSWSSPAEIYGAGGFPEYPKIAVGPEDTLHVVWFVRDSLWEAGARKVWYSSKPTALSFQTPGAPVSAIPAPTPTSTPAPVPSPSPVSTPYPTLSPDATGLPEGIYTEYDEVLRLALALSPVLLLVGVIVAVRLGWFRRARG